MNYADEMNDENYGSFEWFQREAMKTAVYPGRHTFVGLAYVALKLAGEAGEAAEKVGKALRDDDIVKSIDIRQLAIVQFDGLSPERKVAILNEVGDVLWYVAAICCELGVPMSEVAERVIEKLQKRTLAGTVHGDGDNR